MLELPVLVVLEGDFDEVGVIPVTSRRPPIPPNADIREFRLVLLEIPPVTVGDAVLSLVHLLPVFWAGSAGGIGRIEFVRLGGLPGIGSEVAFWRALSSHEDLVGDHRLRERVSVLVDIDRRLGGDGDRSISGVDGGVTCGKDFTSV